MAHRSPLGRKPGRRLERPLRSAVHNSGNDSQADCKRYGRVRDDLKDIWLQPRRPGELSLRDIASSERPPGSPTAALAGTNDPLQQARKLTALARGPRRLVYNDDGELNARRDEVKKMTTKNYWNSRAGKIGAPETPTPAADSPSPPAGFPSIKPGQRCGVFSPTLHIPQTTIEERMEQFRKQRDAAAQCDASPQRAPPRTAPAGAGGSSPLRQVNEKQVGNFVYRSQECSAAKPYIPMEQPRPSDEYCKLDRALRKLHPYEHRRR